MSIRSQDRIACRSKRISLLLFVLALVFGSAAFAAPVPDSLIVRFRATAPSARGVLTAPASRRALAQVRGVKRVDVLLPREGIVRVRVHGTAAAAIAALRLDPSVIYIEQDHRAYALLNPDDPHFVSGYQWSLPRVSAPAAWDLTTGSPDVAVAVLDTGVDPAHPDLSPKLLPGYNAFDGSANTDDFHGHGTHVAGIAAAATNNGVGVAGAGFRTRIVPVKVLDDTGSGSYSGIIDGIRWATDRGVKVINLSLGGDRSSQALQDAVNYAWERGVVVVAAAGNSGNTGLLYPAAMDNVVSVAATNGQDNRASFSNYGSTIDVAAPGTAILSTTPTHAFAMEANGVRRNYEYLQGTSMATPIVAGQAALLFARSGLRTPPTLIVEAIRTTMDPVADITIPGRVNFLRSLEYLPADAFPSPPSAPSDLVATAGVMQVNLSWASVASASTYTLKRSTTSGGPYSSIASGLTTTSYSDTGLTNGTTYYYVVTAVNSAGESGNSNEASATPAALPALRINSGGGEYTAADGRVFLADVHHTNGIVHDWGSVSVANTSDPALYRTIRWNRAPATLDYRLPAADGNYTLKLHFAELSSSVDAPGKHVIDVFVNGTRVLANLDVFVEAGGRNRALVKSLPVTASGGSVTLSVRGVVASPFVCAIELDAAS